MNFCFLQINQEKIYLLSRTLEIAVSSSLRECVLITWGGWTQHRTRWCFCLLWIFSSVILDGCNHGNVNLKALQVSVSAKLYDFIHFLWLNEAPVGELQWGLVARFGAWSFVQKCWSSYDSSRVGGDSMSTQHIDDSLFIKMRLGFNKPFCFPIYL